MHLSRMRPAFEPISLPYNLEALSRYYPLVDSYTHYYKHHQGYCDKLNELVDFNADLISLVTHSQNIAIHENAGGVYCHDLFWYCLTPKNTSPRGQLLTQIEQNWSSLEHLYQKIVELAKQRVGSGWIWLVDDFGTLKLVVTKDHETVIPMNYAPLLVIDLWEHAYYLTNKNRREEWLQRVFKMLNWNYICARYDYVTNENNDKFKVQI